MSSIVCRAGKLSGPAKKTSANVDDVKQFLPESFYSAVKDTAKWGDSWFEIVPYRPIAPTEGTVRFTKKYYGQTKTGTNTRWEWPTISGCAISE